jgi:hypothetical protein
VSRRIFRPKRDEIKGGWGKVHNEELQNLYFTPDIIGEQVKEDEMDKTCSSQGRKEKCIYGVGGRARW